MSTVARCTVVLSFLLLLALAAYAQNVSINDYQFPVSSARNLLVNATYDWKGTKDIPQTNTFHSDASFYSFYSSLPFAWFLNANGSVDHSLGTDWNYNTFLQPKVNKYIFDDKDWFASGLLTFNYSKADSQPEIDAFVGAGYGRYLNATALAKAVRIEDLLLKENVIKDHMPKETMIKIANIIERESEYNDRYGTTYEVQWFSDIEKEVKASGLLVGDELGALGLFRIRQVLFPGQTGTPPVNNRYVGWDGSAGVTFQLMNPLKQDLRTPALTLIGDYAYPIDWSMQLNGNVQINTPMDSSFFKGYNVKGEVDYLYELSNRINFTTVYNLQYSKQPNIDAVTTHSLSANFLFYIENNINYVVTGSMIKSGDLDAVLGVSMSLQYRLLY